MDTPSTAFDFEYVPTTIAFGRGIVATLSDRLADRGLERALVVCGSNVGANRDVMAPVEDGLGDRLVGVFDETTPAKHVGTVLDGADRLEEGDVDVLVALGGGSTLNVARAMSAVAATGLDREAALERTVEEGAVPTSDDDVAPTPIVAIPTTMAGADVSAGGGVNLTAEPTAPVGTDERLTARVSDPRLMAELIVYDPDLFATTPAGILASSAMNGFDKGIETLYSRRTTPISDAHAVTGLRYYASSLPELLEAPADADVLDRAVIGTVLVQYGRFTNVIHTFGNGVSFHYDVQQGTVHGIMAPHVLRYVFDRVDGRREAIATALGIETASRSPAAVAEAVVERVAAIRDDLGLPDRLRTVEGLEREHLPAVAEVIAASRKHERNPAGIDPDVGDVLDVLEAAW